MGTGFPEHAGAKVCCGYRGAPPILAAGVICAAAGGLALGTDGPALTMIVGVAGAGAFALALAGGLLGHRVAPRCRHRLVVAPGAVAVARAAARADCCESAGRSPSAGAPAIRSNIGAPLAVTVAAY